MDNEDFLEEDDYNYFTDSSDGRLLIDLLGRYFNEFDEIDNPSDEQIQEAFRQSIGDIAKLLEAATSED